MTVVQMDLIQTLGEVPAISVESSRLDINRQLPHLPTPFNPAIMAAQLGMFTNPQLLNMMQSAKVLLQNIFEFP
ncbi:hypothetical protein TELCIR_02547 [Teladorsagia circumcincta]|uniref:Uncharacterized protein n=1 Tax=Teladorsagia circumcincta TaxID=45464 RepID=A0A2G9UYW6_TELCI|nr:hypothetical protein TELCIR_02547 [Teladorsagia circumcincta]